MIRTDAEISAAVAEELKHADARSRVYKEGMAEYLGTHRWQDGRLTLGYTPRSREESLGWGRVPAIQKVVAEQAQALAIL